AESRSLSCVVARSLEGRPRHPDRQCGDADTAAVEPGHGDDEPLSLAAQKGAVGHEAVVERDSGSDSSVLSELLLWLTEDDTRRVLLDDEGAHAPGAGADVGLRHHEVELSLAT